MKTKASKQRLVPVLLALSTLLIMVLTTTSCAFMTDYHYPLENIEWEEITQEQATARWDSFDTKSVPYKHVTVYTDDVGSPQKWIGASIKGKTFKDATVDIWYSSREATILPEEFPENATFYQDPSNPNLIRIKTQPENAIDGKNSYSDCIYNKGWLLEACNYRSYTDRTYFYIQYPDSRF